MRRWFNNFMSRNEVHSGISVGCPCPRWHLRFPCPLIQCRCFARLAAQLTLCVSLQAGMVKCEGGAADSSLAPANMVVRYSFAQR
jgi:hypothetical protein